jgi:hypothetical protein
VWGVWGEFTVRVAGERCSRVINDNLTIDVALCGNLLAKRGSRG